MVTVTLPYSALESIYASSNNFVIKNAKILVFWEKKVIGRCNEPKIDTQNIFKPNKILKTFLGWK